MLGQSSPAGLKILGEILKLLPIFFRFGGINTSLFCTQPCPNTLDSGSRVQWGVPRPELELKPWHLYLVIIRPGKFIDL